MHALGIREPYRKCLLLFGLSQAGTPARERLGQARSLTQAKRRSEALTRAIVAAVQPRTGLVREMRSGDGGAGGGRNSAGARPDRSVSRHAARSAASRCQRAESMPNFASALKIDRP